MQNCSLLLQECFRSSQIYKIIHQHNNNLPLVENRDYNNNLTQVENRDYNQMYNPLYPPYNRTDTHTMNDIMNNKNIFNIKTRNYNDTPRMIAYFYSKDGINDQKNIYKLYGFSKDRQNNNDVFYYSFSNDNLKN